MREKSDFRESAAVPAVAEAPPHYHGHRKRLRARFRQAGAQGLAEYELLELVLFRALPRRDVKPIAKKLLEKFGSFAEVVFPWRQWKQTSIFFIFLATHVV